MKQTVEEAAKQELISSYAIVIEGELVYQRQAMLNMFKKGADWQSKQSPWISVKERLPEENKEYGYYRFTFAHQMPGMKKEVTEAASYKAEAEAVKPVPVEQYGFQPDEISTSWFVTEGIIP